MYDRLPIRLFDPETTSGSAAAETEATGTGNNTDGNSTAASQQSASNAVAGYDIGTANTAGNAAGQDAGAGTGFVIPEAYRDRVWAQNFAKTADPVAEIFKSYDNAQKLIGQRPPVTPPGDDATPEQIKAWRQYVGIPDDAGAYKYEAPKLEGDDARLVEHLNKERPAEFISAMAAKAHELGITPKQFAALAEAYDIGYINHNKATIMEMQQAEAAMNTDFESKAAAALGDRKEAVLKNGKTVLDKAIPADSPVRVYLGQFNNEQLTAVALVAGMMYDKYEREDGFGSKQVGAGAANKEQLEAEITSLMSQPAFRDKMHGDHAKVNTQINSLYERMGLTGAVYNK